MKAVTQNDVIESSSSHLGLSSSFLSSLEGLAAFARRVASYKAPCTEWFLRRSLLELVRGLEDDEVARNKFEPVVEGLLDQGDLLEVEDAESDSLLLALRAPSALGISPTKILLLGLLPEGSDPVPSEFRDRLSLHGYARLLAVDESADALRKLHMSGYLIISEEEWGLPPARQDAQKFLDSYLLRIRTDTPVGHLEGLRILDRRRPVTYYNGRWESQHFPDGDFVARRQRRFGNESWCLVRIRDGVAQALLDFPTKNFRYRACDEAWHLQQAIDCVAGTPQRFRVRKIGAQEHVVEVFSPIPLWAHRRWNLVAEQTSMPGCLFAYRFPTEALETEISFAETRMWLAPL
jgi:hypothetical protein